MHEGARHQGLECGVTGALWGWGGAGGIERHVYAFAHTCTAHTQIPFSTHRNMSSITALVCFLALASYSSLCSELLGCSAPTPLLQQLEPGHTDFMIMIHEIPYTGAEVAPTASVIGRRQLSDTPIDTPGVALVTAYSKSDQQRMGWVELFQRAARAGLGGGEAT